MSQVQQLFKTGVGFATGKVWYLDGNGEPSGAMVDIAPIGSYYSDATTGDTYRKRTAGTGADKWGRLATADELAALISGISWREPADVLVTSTTTSSLVTSMNSTNTADGVAVFEGMRILIKGLDVEDDNVYVVGGTTGAWTLVEDANEPTNGDSLFVNSGTHEGEKFTYGNSGWVLSDQASRDEFNAIRAFIGKPAAGSNLPQYASTNYIANDDSLRDAAGKLDAKLGLLAAPAITRTFRPVVESQSFAANVANLNQAIGADVTSTNHLNVNQSVNANLSALDQFIGGALAAGNFVTPANTLTQNVAALDVALDRTVKRVTTENVTDATVVGSALTRSIPAAKFIVEASLASDRTRKYVTEYLVTHNGTDVADATAVHTVQVGELVVGTEIAGLSVTFGLAGVGAAQVVEARVAASSAVDVKTVRIFV